MSKRLSVNHFMSPDDIKSLIINLLASTVFVFLTWLITKLLGLSQTISLIFILLGVSFGILLGWWFHFLRTLKIVRVSIGEFDTDLKFLARSKHIDMIAITFDAFLRFNDPIHDAIFKHDAPVRILLLNPKCKNFKEFAALPEERFDKLAGESHRTVSFLDALKKNVDEENEKRKSRSQPQMRGSIQYRFFESIPFHGFMITDNTVRYWPYLYHRNPSRAPTYHVARNSKIAKTLAQEFETIWNTSKQQKQNSWIVRKIVSGGQTGADRAALDWAILHQNQIEHGGYCPKGRKADDGTIAEQYKLEETITADYAERTELNVQKSDGTVIFSIEPRLTGGSLSSLYFAVKYGKPCLHLHKQNSNTNHSIRLLAFLHEHDIEVLNVAGPREKTESNIGAFVTDILEKAFVEAKSETS